MFSAINHSKELIRCRMLKHALNYWNIKNPNDLDPVVKLMLEALSTELYSLGNDIKDTETRLLEKIAQLLAPDCVTGPQPAHGILHALPVEPVEYLQETTHFITQKKVFAKGDEAPDKSVDLFFTPVEPVRLVSASVRFIATGNSLFGYDQQFQKQLIARGSGTHRLPNNELWLALETDQKLPDLEKISFYFDWSSAPFQQSDMNYQVLPLSRWYMNGRELKTAAGMPPSDRSSTGCLREDLLAEQDATAIMVQDITSYYGRRFITITGHLPLPSIQDDCLYPSSFMDVFTESDLRKITTGLVWLKIAFPAAVDQDSLDEVQVFTNAFPVVNRQLHDLKFRLRGGSTIIPMKTTGTEQFMSVRSLSDENHTYRFTPFRKQGEEEFGSYTVRSGGLERFDERNAREYISQLLELLRSESAAFAAYGNDFIGSTLQELNQRIALIEQKIKAIGNDAGEVPHYIIARPPEGNEIMYATYWVTRPEIANTIRSGTCLQEHNGCKTKANATLLLSTTKGGANRLKSEERLNAFRYGLLTRNRIVTKEDIRNFCLHELGKCVAKVTVDRGFEMSGNPQHGFYRTIDISIKPQQGENLSVGDWQARLDQVKYKLQSRSGMSNHYRMLLDDGR